MCSVAARDAAEDGTARTVDGEGSGDRPEADGAKMDA
jgi:hypothetical protein